MPVKLYSYWRSSAAYRVRIALNVKQIDHEIVPVSLAPGEDEHRTDAYRKKNPQMLVPFLEDENVRIGQSIAILEYLEEHYSAVALLPKTQPLRSQVRAFCQVIACDIHPLLNLRILKYLKSELATDPMAHWYPHWIHEGFKALEALATDGPFVFGDSVTLADSLLVPQMYNARRFEVPLDDYPKLVAADKHCNDLETFRRARPEDQLDSPGLSKSD